MAGVLNTLFSNEQMKVNMAVAATATPQTQVSQQATVIKLEDVKSAIGKTVTVQGILSGHSDARQFKCTEMAAKRIVF